MLWNHCSHRSPKIIVLSSYLKECNFKTVLICTCKDVCRRISVIFPIILKAQPIRDACGGDHELIVQVLSHKKYKTAGCIWFVLYKNLFKWSIFHLQIDTFFGSVIVPVMEQEINLNNSKLEYVFLTDSDR